MPSAASGTTPSPRARQTICKLYSCPSPKDARRHPCQNGVGRSATAVACPGGHWRHRPAKVLGIGGRIEVSSVHALSGGGRRGGGCLLYAHPVSTSCLDGGIHIFASAPGSHHCPVRPRRSVTR